MVARVAKGKGAPRKGALRKPDANTRADVQEPDIGTMHGDEGATQPEVLTIEYGASCSFGGYAWKAVEEYPGRAIGSCG
jgi:hypothetical protein